MIRKLRANWYKGFRELDMEPEGVNLLIGANGTGKTNFADLIEFIAMTARFGLRESVEKLGGLDQIRTDLPTGRPPALKITIELDQDIRRGIKKANYSFSLSCSKVLTIDEEELEAELFLQPLSVRTLKTIEENQSNLIKIKFKRKKGKMIEISGFQNIGLSDLNRSIEDTGDIEDRQVLLLNFLGFSPLRRITQYLSAMRVYNIDSTIAKMTTSSGENELDRSGANLIFFLKRILDDKAKKEILLEYLRNSVPYIKEIEIQRILTYTTLKFSEIDSKLDFRAQQMSDGTIRLLGLLAIFTQFRRPPVVVIEEPENALHSYAIRSLVNLIKNVSIQSSDPTQTFLTTHSPLVVDAVLAIDSEIEVPRQCFVTSRKKGSSTISPISHKIVEAIAKNLGRPSDFLREGSFGDLPTQLELPIQSQQK
jgi:predicted ATPase